MPQTIAELSRSTPESVGLSSKNVLAFVDAVEAADLELHSLMILKDHQVVAEGWWAPYRQEDIHLLYSLSKSFTSTAIGFAVQEGLVDIDAPVLTYFPSEAPENPSDKLKAMKVRHLLSMSTGHAADDMGSDMTFREDGDWVRGFLGREVVYDPGTHFLYNNGASYTLSAIVSKVTGMSALDYLRPRLLDPIGIDHATWTTCPKGVSMGATELRITTESIARFGQFYLDRGVWNRQQLLSAEWIDLATSFQVPNANGAQSDWEQGYGFQFWRCRHDCYRGDGAFGQFCIVIPKFNMVVAMTSSVSDMQAVLDLVWEYLLGPAKSEAIPADLDAHDILKKRLASLTLPAPMGNTKSPIIPEVSGKIFKSTAETDGFDTCTFDFDPMGCTMTVRTSKGDRSIRAGCAQWVKGVTSIEGLGGKRIASIGRWTAEDTYEIKVRYTESPSGIRIVSKFAEKSVRVQLILTARFGSPDGPTFEGSFT
jgi:CubicO group peptidase (beta-lactamase class C family)